LISFEVDGTLDIKCVALQIWPATSILKEFFPDDGTTLPIKEMAFGNPPRNGFVNSTNAEYNTYVGICNMKA
jgi:hypothetical protein